MHKRSLKLFTQAH